MHKVIELTADIRVQATKDNKPPKIIIDPAYNGGPMPVYGYEVPIVIDLKGLELPGQVPIAADHSTELTGLLGQGTPSIKSNRLLVVGTLNNSTPAREVVEMAKSGQKFQASIGAEPVEVKYMGQSESAQVNGRTIQLDSGFYLIGKSRLREVSIVGIGADADTNVRIAARAKLNNNFGDVDMKPEQIKEIRACCDRFAQVIPADDLRKIEGQALEGGWSLERTSEACLNRMDLEQVRTSRPDAPLGRPRYGVAVGNRGVLAAASLLLYGRQGTAEKHFDAQTLQMAEDLRCHCALDLCAKACELAGQTVPSGQSDLIKAAFSTADLSNALASSASKELIEAYEAAPATWRSIAAIKPTKNFHQHSAIRGVLNNGIYQPVADTGELQHAKLTDESYTYQSDTRGLMFGISRKDIVNDDIGVIFDLQVTLGINAARTICKIFWELVRDTETFFTESHSNYLAGSGTVLSIDALSTAILQLRQQVDGDNNPLAIPPRVLAVPPSLEAKARQIVASLEVHRTDDADNSPTANPWKNLELTLEVEPHLGANAGGSDTGWYLFGDPRIAPAMITSFLNGVDRPTVESSDTDFNTLGAQFRAYLDFGCDLADYRGSVKMLGASE